MANQNFIVGDAGGTNTQWRVVKDGRIEQFETAGFNAYTHDVEKWKDSIKYTLNKELNANKPIFIYAAGIDISDQKNTLESSLRSVFSGNVTAENDLLGVARSLCGKSEGNVCILGTGANACFYNGTNVNKVSASLGYILGDEGSGAYLGKKLIQKVFRNQISNDIIGLFQEEFSLTSHQVIQRIYNENMPNQYLASFAPFIHKNRHHPEVFEMIKESFREFFKAFFANTETKEIPFHFSGSVGFYFSDILREVGSDLGIQIMNIVQSPIAGLVLYHQQYD